MKNCFWGIILLIMLVAGCAGGAKPADSSPVESSPVESVAENTGGMTLDLALKEAAARIDERIAAKTKIALLNLSSPSDRFSSYALDELEANLLDSGRLTVVDRKEVDLIRNEFDFQFSGEVGEDSMQDMGRMLGAQSIATGSLTEIGGSYRIVIRVLNVQGATVEAQYRTDIVADARVRALLEGGRSGATARITQRASATQTPTTPSSSAPAPVAVPAQAETVPAPAVPTPPPVPIVYKIGDTGPAGGLIFYDKGDNSDGWRYLEAAPARTEMICPWATEDFSMQDIHDERGVGKGKSNTKAIMIQAMDRGGGWGWAGQACDELDVNGFNDWFLPSRDELNMMWGALHRKGLGGFKADWYWSSTPTTYWYSNYSAAWRQNFTDGKQSNGERLANSRGDKLRVRAVRQF